MDISDKIFTYIDSQDNITRRMVEEYRNSFIVIGDESKAFIPALGAYIGGIGRSTYEYIMSLIDNYQSSVMPLKYNEEENEFNLAFTYLNQNGTSYIYYNENMLINPGERYIKTDTFKGDLDGNAYTASYLQNTVRLWGHDFTGVENIEDNIIPSEDNSYTIGEENKRFAYSYISHMIGYLHGNAETSSYAQYSTYNYQVFVKPENRDDTWNLYYPLNADAVPNVATPANSFSYLYTSAHNQISYYMDPKYQQGIGNITMYDILFNPRLQIRNCPPIYYIKRDESLLFGTYFRGNLIGISSYASYLWNDYSINGTPFDGSQDITTSYWGYERDFTINDHNNTYSGSSVSVHGDQDVILNLPEIICADIYGNSYTASSSYLSNIAYMSYLNTTNKNINYYLMFTDNNIDIPSYAYVNSGIYYNPSSKTLNVSYLEGWLKGTADKALILKDKRKINGTYFDGSNDITTTYWGYERNFMIKDFHNTYDGDIVPVHGDQDIILHLPEIIHGDLYGNAYTSSSSYLSNIAYMSYMYSTAKNTNYYLIFTDNNVNNPSYSYINSGIYYNPYNRVLTTSYFEGWLRGSADNAVVLKDKRKINGTYFDGSDDITTTYWGNERDFTIKDYDNSYASNPVHVHGDKNIVLNLPQVVKMDIIGNSTYSTTSYLANNSHKLYNTNVSNNQNYYISFTDINPGTYIYSYSYTNVGLKYNPYTRTITTSYFKGWLRGSADNAVVLKDKRKINGTYFDGSDDITTTYWGTARNITIADYHNTYSYINNNIDGGNDIELKLPENIHGNLHGNADTATYSNTSYISNQTYREKINTTNSNTTYYVTITNMNSGYGYTYINSNLNYNPKNEELTSTYFNATKLFRGRVRARDQWGIIESNGTITNGSYNNGDDNNGDINIIEVDPISSNTYEDQYFTIVALEPGTFSFNRDIEYSVNNGSTWNTLQANTNSPIINTNDKIIFKNTNLPNTGGIGTFDSTGRYNVEGNIMSLLFGDNFQGKNNLLNYNSVFEYLFMNNDKLVNANNLILPATILSYHCYGGMFWGCTSLINTPELPATQLASYCYSGMFRKCTSLTFVSDNLLPAIQLASYCYNGMFMGSGLINAPELPAMNLENNCYSGMFYMCQSLINAPRILPAIELKLRCYDMMFETCTSLKIAPELPALELVGGCYEQMFYCSGVNYIKALFLTNPSDGFTGFAQYTNNWVFGVSSTGTFVKNSVATWTGTGDYLIPSGWTVTT